MSSVGLLRAADRVRRSRAYLDDLFPKQRAFFADTAKIKCAVCGRRAGKTWCCAAGLYDAAKRFPRSLNPYICLSGVSARRIMWPVLEEFNDRYKLGMKMHSHELVAELPENGSQIFCVGGDDMRKVEALRGGKYGRAIIDESGSQPRELLRYLCEDVLDAALMDLNGDLWLVGSPNAACVGYFYDLTNGTNPDVAGVATHHWTVLDNVHIPHAADYLAQKREAKHWTVDHPVYRREYLGQWVRDRSSLVFRFDRARHMVATVPEEMRGAIGVDLGGSKKIESTAFVLNMWAKYLKTVFTVLASKHANYTPSDGADRLTAIHEVHPGARIAVVDAGGLGGGYIEEWRRREGLPVNVKEAEKRDKYAYVELLNGELDNGAVKLLAGRATQPLVDELELLQWNEDRDGFDDRFMDHATDAWLYSWRECYAWAEAGPQAETPPMGTVARKQHDLDKHKDQLIRDSLRRAAKVSPRQALDRLRRY